MSGREREGDGGGACDNATSCQSRQLRLFHFSSSALSNNRFVRLGILKRAPFPPPLSLSVLPAAASAYALSLTLSLTIQRSIRKTSLGRGYAALSLVLAAFGMSLCRPLSTVRCPLAAVRHQSVVSFPFMFLVFRFCFASVSLCLCSNRELALHT